MITMDPSRDILYFYNLAIMIQHIRTCQTCIGTHKKKLVYVYAISKCVFSLGFYLEIPRHTGKGVWPQEGLKGLEIKYAVSVMVF